jgi:hypothetical protein
MQVRSGDLVRKRDGSRGTVGIRGAEREISARVIPYSLAVTAEENRKSWQIRSRSRNLSRVYAGLAKDSGLQSHVNNNRPVLATSHTRTRAFLRGPSPPHPSMPQWRLPIDQSIILSKSDTNLRHHS